MGVSCKPVLPSDWELPNRRRTRRLSGFNALVSHEAAPCACEDPPRHYSVLAIRLPVNTKVAENSAMPTTARVAAEVAVTAAGSRPGCYENTCSTSTDPPEYRIWTNVTWRRRGEGCAGELAQELGCSTREGEPHVIAFQHVDSRIVQRDVRHADHRHEALAAPDDAARRQRSHRLPTPRWAPRSRTGTTLAAPRTR